MVMLGHDHGPIVDHLYMIPWNITNGSSFLQTHYSHWSTSETEVMLDHDHGQIVDHL